MGGIAGHDPGLARRLSFSGRKLINFCVWRPRCRYPCPQRREATGELGSRRTIKRGSRSNRGAGRGGLQPVTSPSRNLAAGGGSRRLAGARAGVRPPARSRPFLALAAVVSRHACAVSHIPCTPTLPLVVRPSLLNPPCGLQVAVVVVVSPTRCPARGGMSAMGGRGKLCAAAVAGMTSCRALLLRS